MTMSAAILDWIEARGLDPEVGDRLGFDGRTDGGDDQLVISFIREGKVVRRKYRPLVHREGQQRFFQDKGGIRCAWNEDCLRDPSLFGKPLIITEGEMDGWSAVQCGFAKTISVPDGAPKEVDDEKRDDHAAGLEESVKYAWLRDLRDQGLLSRERCPEIILATDGDPAGEQLMDDLSRLLMKARCKFLTYPKAKDPDRVGRPRLKDLNEVLQDYGAKGVAATVDKAQFIKVVGVARMSELPPPTPRRIYDIGFDVYGSHCKIRGGDFSVWTGVPGSGKTTFVQDIMCRIVEQYGITVAWGSFEQDPKTDHLRNFRRWFNHTPVWKQTVEEKEAADAWIDRHHVFIVPDEEEDATLEWLLEKMEVAVTRYGAEVVVIDPFNELDHLRERHETQSEYVGRAIKTIKQFAKRMNVHVAVVAHPAKLQKNKDTGLYQEVSPYDIADSAHWFNKPDLIVIVHRVSVDDTKVKTAKSKYHDVIGTPGSVLMQFGKDTGRFVETEKLSS